MSPHASTKELLMAHGFDAEIADQISVAMNSHDDLVATLKEIKMECSAGLQEVSNETFAGRKAHVIFELISRLINKSISKMEARP